MATGPGTSKNLANVDNMLTLWFADNILFWGMFFCWPYDCRQYFLLAKWLEAIFFCRPFDCRQYFFLAVCLQTIFFLGHMIVDNIFWPYVLLQRAVFPRIHHLCWPPPSKQLTKTWNFASITTSSGKVFVAFFFYISNTAGAPVVVVSGVSIHSTFCSKAQKAL